MSADKAIKTEAMRIERSRVTGWGHRLRMLRESRFAVTARNIGPADRRENPEQPGKWEFADRLASQAGRDGFNGSRAAIMTPLPPAQDSSRTGASPTPR